MSTMQMPLTEAQFQKQVVDLATYQGWQWMHIEQRASNGNGSGWHVPIKGPLGKGFPDLMMVRGKSLIFVELKAQGGVLSEAQRQMQDTLRWVGLTYVWRPSDWAEIAEVLANA
jgi:hypothetical protein